MWELRLGGVMLEFILRSKILCQGIQVTIEASRDLQFNSIRR
jgi:hypothetical protein